MHVTKISKVRYTAGECGSCSGVNRRGSAAEQGVSENNVCAPANSVESAASYLSTWMGDLLGTVSGVSLLFILLTSNYLSFS
ncbi:Hypothetical protein SRAE_2000060800 [Strongyloides ratti]|uniref:Uncharacterized protein n=1 Tax=Strongyloides ratti TaxID=34506 RepID=A0A090MXS3_STRRB|nr:Hypothetical protein SRAE_2000060800 [Strongyloides ratti]CEF65934.1 Hypothetical protein SRAE_2000060800 [Strongyloides ratti]